MTRWRVRYSTRTQVWFYADSTTFVDAESARAAVALVESRAETGASRQAWACTPATPEMERQHKERSVVYAEWQRRLKAGESVRGLV